MPVVRIREQEDRIGGAGNVAANAAALGARVTLVGLTGDDADADALEALCGARGLHAQLLREPAATTTVKLRVMAQHQQLLRVDFEDEPQTLSAAVTARLEPLLRSTLENNPATGRTVVVFSDYAKGALAAVSSLLGCARAQGAFCIVDPKGRDFARYHGADLLTPNLGEFEAVVGVCADLPTLVARARELCARHALGAVLVTRGESGMSLVTAMGEALHLSAMARDVFDVTGAGDTVCAALAWAIAAGEELAEAVRLANSAAGIAVGKLGTAVVTRAELARVDSHRPSREHQIFDRATLLERVAEAKGRGERIVMTNGCFDILHVGHVRYLEAAAALGDRLIVAINTDASVQRLKGPRRPVNALADRMEVLQRLAAVDWVVPFDEDTPRDLIAAVVPDILVKGGDYEVSAIAGAAEVQAAGGQVLTLPFHAGHSTTAMLARAADDATGSTTS